MSFRCIKVFLLKERKREKGKKKEGRKSIVLQSWEKRGIRENDTSVNIWRNYTVCAISISFTHDDAELSLPADKC